VKAPKFIGKKRGYNFKEDEWINIEIEDEITAKVLEYKKEIFKTVDQIIKTFNFTIFQIVDSPYHNFRVESHIKKMINNNILVEKNINDYEKIENILYWDHEKQQQIKRKKLIGIEKLNKEINQLEDTNKYKITYINIEFRRYLMIHYMNVLLNIMNEINIVMILDDQELGFILSKKILMLNNYQALSLMRKFFLIFIKFKLEENWNKNNFKDNLLLNFYKNHGNEFKSWIEINDLDYNEIKILFDKFDEMRQILVHSDDVNWVGPVSLSLAIKFNNEEGNNSMEETYKKAGKNFNDIIKRSDLLAVAAYQKNKEELLKELLKDNEIFFDNYGLNFTNKEFDIFELSLSTLKFIKDFLYKLNRAIDNEDIEKFDISSKIHMLNNLLNQ